MEKYYIAYGSNLNEAQMRQRCPGAKRIAAGTLEGYRITFRSNWRIGVANIEPRKGSSVPVGIWAISAQNEKSLDRYEGFPTLYTKETVRIKLPDLRTVDAIIYVMPPHRPWAKPSADYLNVIKQGYKDFGFDNRKLIYAARNPTPLSSPKFE